MWEFASLILGKYCTFVCGTLFGGIKLNEFHSPEKSSNYKSAILADYYEGSKVAQFGNAQ
jgi:hypothetical protein